LTELNGAEVEEDRIITITKTVLKLMMQNGRKISQAVNITALARDSNCKRQTRPLVGQGAPHQETRDCLRVIQHLFLST
jgi:hypothetical protein